MLHDKNYQFITNITAYFACTTHSLINILRQRCFAYVQNPSGFTALHVCARKCTAIDKASTKKAATKDDATTLVRTRLYGDPKVPGTVGYEVTYIFLLTIGIFTDIHFLIASCVQMSLYFNA